MTRSAPLLSCLQGGSPAPSFQSQQYCAAHSKCRAYFPKSCSRRGAGLALWLRYPWGWLICAFFIMASPTVSPRKRAEFTFPSAAAARGMASSLSLMTLRVSYPDCLRWREGAGYIPLLRPLLGREVAGSVPPHSVLWLANLCLCHQGQFCYAV